MFCGIVQPDSGQDTVFNANCAFLSDNARCRYLATARKDVSALTSQVEALEAELAAAKGRHTAELVAKVCLQ